MTWRKLSCHVLMEDVVPSRALSACLPPKPHRFGLSRSIWAMQPTWPVKLARVVASKLGGVTLLRKFDTHRCDFHKKVSTRFMGADLACKKVSEGKLSVRKKRT
jgi:hypothetical protein